MSNCKICGSIASSIKKVEGYKENKYYQIYYCESCDASFSDCYPDDSSIYNLIYENASFISGYGRYDTYKNNVLKNENPFEYLSEAEDMYWAIKQSISKGHLKKTSKILEVGCGMGYLTFSLNKEGFDIKGCDISEKAIEKAKKTYGLSSSELFFVADIYKISENDSLRYDTIILTEVIEHIYDPLHFINTLLKLLKNNGNVIITTPNKTAYKKSVFWTSDLPPVHYWWLSENSFEKIALLTNSSIQFIDFSQYNIDRHLFVDDDNIKDGVSTFDKNGNLLLKSSKFLFMLKFLIKKTWAFDVIKYVKFKLTKKDISKSYVLCCILQKR